MGGGKGGGGVNIVNNLRQSEIFRQDQSTLNEPHFDTIKIRGVSLGPLIMAIGGRIVLVVALVW